jgi:hypothetical protein
MSEALSIYAVPEDRLLAVPGSRDRQLIARIGRGYPLAAYVDQMIEESNELAEEEGDEDRIEVALLEAVRRVVEGEPLTGADGSFVYGFAYHAICRSVGRELPCAFLPFDFGRLDASLAGLGVALRVTDLCFGGPAFPLPEPGEFPSLGRWTCEQLGAAGRERVQRAPLVGLDAVAAACVRQVQEWYSQLEEEECVVGVLY